MVIYFDNSATTMPKETVLNSFVEANKRFYQNPASLHLAGRDVDALLNKSRQQLLQSVGAKEGHVIYTSGGTEANNLALLGFARNYKNRGNHIITTAIEHPSVLNAAEQLEREGFKVDYLSVNEQGVIDVSKLEELLTDETIVVSIMHVNNEVGAIQPIERCAEVIHQRSRAIFHVDAVQSFGKLPIQLNEQGPDAISLSAHKIHGLKGTGALITKRFVLPKAITYGGGQEEGLRNGTVAVPNAVVFAKAARLALQETNVERYKVWREELMNHIEASEKAIVLAKDSAAPHILSIAFPKIRGEVAVNFFQNNGITCSTSSACSSKSGNISHVIEAMKIPAQYREGVIRISFGEMNKASDIEQFKEVYRTFIKVLGRGKNHEVE